LIPGTSHGGLIAAVTLLVASVIVVFTELAAAAGVFAALVERLAQWGLAKRWILWYWGWPP
jgi:hypothetical protein